MPTVWLKEDCLDPSHATSNIMSNIRWTLHDNDRPNHCFLMTNLRRFRFLIVFKRSFPLLRMLFRCLVVYTYKYGDAPVLLENYNITYPSLFSCYFLRHRWLGCGFYFRKCVHYLSNPDPFLCEISLNFNVLALFYMVEAIFLFNIHLVYIYLRICPSLL